MVEIGDGRLEGNGHIDRSLTNAGVVSPGIGAPVWGSAYLRRLHANGARRAHAGRRRDPIWRFGRSFGRYRPRRSEWARSLTLVNGFNSSAGQAVVVMTYGSRFGTFFDTQFRDSTNMLSASYIEPPISTSDPETRGAGGSSCLTRQPECSHELRPVRSRGSITRRSSRQTR